MALVDLLGHSLLAKDSEKSTSEALKDAKAIALYFSAHWCPPCRGFTPQLVQWYKKDLQAKGLEVVFVSGDHSEEEFKEYFAEMPWLAVDFAQKEVSTKLNKKFKVRGIPSLVILEPSGEVITTDGRQAVAEDPEGKKFPWIPPKTSDLLHQMKLTNAAGSAAEVSLTQAMAGKKALALYFSAHWCPPCRGFTPKLAEWYKKDLSAKGLEVVFVSSDKDEGQFEGYFKEMPWLALDYKDRELKEQLSKQFKVDGIPSLVVLDSNLEVVTLKGREAVSGDPEGQSLPWYPKPVHNLAGGPGDIEEVPTVLVFCEMSSASEKQAVEEALTAVASKYVEQQKAAKADAPEVAFSIATRSNPLAGQIRRMIGLQSLPPSPHEHPLEKKEESSNWGCDGCGQAGAGKERYRCTAGCDFDFCGDCHALVSSGGKALEKLPVSMALMDIPSDGAYFVAEAGPINAESIQAFVDAWKSGRIERKQLG